MVLTTEDSPSSEGDKPLYGNICDLGNERHTRRGGILIDAPQCRSEGFTLAVDARDAWDDVTRGSADTPSTRESSDSWNLATENQVLIKNSMEQNRVVDNNVNEIGYEVSLIRCV